MAAVVLTVIGFVLVEEHLHTSDGRVLARTGATTYVFAGILGVAAETLVFPILHDFMPLLIGVPLLRRALSPRGSAQQIEQQEAPVLH